MAAATLHEVFVGFQTGDDDKDSDTALTITFAKADGITVAQLKGTFGTFGNHSTDGFYNIPLVGQSSSQYLSTDAGKLTISIDPVGHDTWKFDCNLWLMFSDGTKRPYSFPGHALSQDVRANTFVVPAP